ncbi:PsbW domain-containing protein [Cephalotus follicularis]|uniref:PSII 6.1 kDa protein n=1 Tax=Cephalotus follicularis TaxID=3775 RepID=A0A1Q3D1E9_CEPFO|nr:PsbW domain-containing protein [Cephalotus follicularis]
MATITTSNLATLLPCTSSVSKGLRGTQSSLLQGVTKMCSRGSVRCTLEEKPMASGTNLGSRLFATLMAGTFALTSSAGPAMALVDERLSTEGTGLPFGLSNNLLGWILLGVFGLIWSFYFAYTASLEEDEDSGLSL